MHDVVSSNRAAPEGISIRMPRRDDLEALARLMLDAYRGTIDYEGEGMDEAIAEVRGHLGGSPLLEHSIAAVAGDEIVSSCLVSEAEGLVIVGYVMTAATHKGRGLGTFVSERALYSLRASGAEEVDAWITEGNIPSERIFRRLGFEMVG